ncbi:MAG: alpha/beta hydrolase, partial [Pseudomonadota bacterium]|nr:alpha/beta hydrolase [Pseudomonadota bacterium]
MKTLRVNEYDMAYLDIGKGSPIVCIHGSLNDFRAWNGVLGPLSANNRLIAPSMRHYFPEHWNGEGGQFRMDQHIDDAIAFIEDLGLGPVNLIGHSRGGHISFRVGLERPDLISKLVLAEPGGTLEDDLMPEETSNLSEGAGSRAHVTRSSERIAAGDLEGGLRAFIDGI